MADEPYDKLQDKLDEMVEALYVTRRENRFPYGQMPGIVKDVLPDAEVVDEWICENVPHYTYDSGPYQLTSKFAELQAEYRSTSLAGPRWCTIRGRDYPDLEPIHGEIPWRVMHEDATIPCSICGKGYNNELGETWCDTPHMIDPIYQLEPKEDDADT